MFCLSGSANISWKNTLVVREKEVASIIIQHCKLLVTTILPLQCNGILHLLSRVMLLVDTRESAPSGMLCLKNHCQSKRNKKKINSMLPTTTVIQITHIQPGTDGLNIFIVSTSINALALYVCLNFISPCFISKIKLIKMLS